MEIALAQAGITPDAIGHLNAHATSTPVGDLGELAAIRTLFAGLPGPAISATKSATGHLLGAAGGLEAIFTALAVRDQIAPPTRNLSEESPEATAQRLLLLAGSQISLFAWLLPSRLPRPPLKFLSATLTDQFLLTTPSAGLWISQYGNPLKEDGLSRELPKVVQRQFGVAMRPHAFRHVAATSIAETDPAHVNIIKDILSHATLAMSEKHYNRATGISSCNALQSIMEDIRKNVPKIGRVHRGHRDAGTCK